ncbi:hypothetical protein DT070_08000 [Polaromonas sp. SP1]|nr:hypothetical protein DT070_08000 [Polaromonas sp. SP1]QGJ17170.1 hypothetical protein F7R28_01420 [Polaromonas sp. Pch-P]
MKKGFGSDRPKPQIVGGWKHPASQTKPGISPTVTQPNSQAQHEPRDWLCQTAGGRPPEGLEPAAPSLHAQAWTGDRGEASREPRPARPRELHEVSDRGGYQFKPMCSGRYTAMPARMVPRTPCRQ